MGTRGFTGLVVDGEEKIGYQQYDSYPSGVGAVVLGQLREMVKDMDSLRASARALKVVSNDVPPTEAEVEQLRGYADLSVSNQTTEDWYCLLRNTHGDLNVILEAGYVEDVHTFPLDSLFCEYGYLVDLDNEVFQVYKGFQKSTPTKGRWATRPTAAEDVATYREHVKWCAENGRDPWMPEVSEYKAVELWAEYPLSALPSNEDFLKLDDEEDED